jgi:taurine--2-oxoglutarate transaminase
MLWVCPPLIINEEELRQGLDLIEEALAATEASLRPTPVTARAEVLART